jgi:hypothetical protein
MGVRIETRSGPMVRLLAVNDATGGTSIADPADTLTNPISPTTGPAAGVIPLGAGGATSPNGLKLIPFGTDTSAQTFLMSVFAIERILGGPAGVADSWTHHLLASFTCTLCTKAGLANTAVNGSQLYCGTIALGVGNANVSCEVVSPTGNQAAHVVIDTKGAELVKVLFALNSSAASMNALWGKV